MHVLNQIGHLLAQNVWLRPHHHKRQLLLGQLFIVHAEFIILQLATFQRNFNEVESRCVVIPSERHIMYVDGASVLGGSMNVLLHQSLKIEMLTIRLASVLPARQKLLTGHHVDFPFYTSDFTPFSDKFSGQGANGRFNL